jgi:hypothetical protein
MIAAGMIIQKGSRAYVVTLFVRAFIITALLTLYTLYGDPALLTTSTVVTIGWILTFIGWRKDTADARHRHHPSTTVVTSRQRIDLIGHGFNSLIGLPPVANKTARWPPRAKRSEARYAPRTLY